MGEILLTAAVLLLALYGCAQGVRWLGGRLFDDGRRQALLLLPLSGVCEDAEYRIRSCLHTAREERLALYVMDNGIAPASRELVGQICTRLSGVRLCSRPELMAALDKPDGDPAQTE